MKETYLRGDLYYANLNPVVGSEQGGMRPVLIIQNDKGNHHSPTVIVAPITSKANVKPKLPTHVFLSGVLALPSIILLEQIRTVDKHRLCDFIGRLDSSVMEIIDERLLISLGINWKKEG